MKVIGITGGIASGKSTVSAIIKEAGFKIIDSDKIAHELLSEKEIIKKIVNHFGETILIDEKINRAQLAKLIFNNQEALDLLNSIMHPLVKAKISLLLLELKDEEIVFVDVPLLYEAHMENDFWRIIVVYISEELQIKRLMKRDNISRDYAKLKISRQLAMDEKSKRADFIINNEGDIQKTKLQVNELIRRLKNEI